MVADRKSPGRHFVAVCRPARIAQLQRIERPVGTQLDHRQIRQNAFAENPAGELQRLAARGFDLRRHRINVIHHVTVRNHQAVRTYDETGAAAGASIREEDGNISDGGFDQLRYFRDGQWASGDWRRRRRDDRASAAVVGNRQVLPVWRSGPRGLAVARAVAQHGASVVRAFLEAIECICRPIRADVGSVDVHVDEGLSPVSRDAGFGPGIVPVHVDATHTVMGSAVGRTPGDDDFARVEAVDDPDISRRCGGGLRCCRYDAAGGGSQYRCDQ